MTDDTHIDIEISKKRQYEEDDVNAHRAKKVRWKNDELDNYSEDERKYYKNLPIEERYRIAKAEGNIKCINKTTTPLRFKVLSSGLSDELKAVAIQKLNYLYSMDESASEYYRITHWVESVCKIPFNIYKSLSVTYKSPKAHIREFLNTVRNNMNKNVYGHTTAKDHIIRLLAQWVSNPDAKGMVIGIHGAHGCGKTTLVKDGICSILGLPFAFIPLGGTNDGCYLEGHSYTYEGAIWGKIVDVLMKAKCMNPVLFFDELDKVSDTSKGEEIINKLIHITDATQNDKVSDKYFAEFDFDLSRSLIIFSYNNENLINPVLKDRMICIHTDGYTTKDKVSICHQHMIPILLQEYSFAVDQIVFPSEVLINIIEYIDKEEGVRNLRRALQDVISNLNLTRLLDNDELFNDVKKYNVSFDDVRKYVHNKKQTDKIHNQMYT